MNTQTTNQTNKTRNTKTAKKVGTTKIEQTKKTAFLNKREKSGLAIDFHETKSKRISDNYKARYVKNLANNISKVESTDKKIVSALSVINDFRQAKFSSERLTERRIKAYANQFKRQSNGLEFSAEDVKRDVMRMANLIWNRKA
jgi:hypothetical protein